LVENFLLPKVLDGLSIRPMPPVDNISDKLADYETLGVAELCSSPYGSISGLYPDNLGIDNILRPFLYV